MTSISLPTVVMSRKLFVVLAALCLFQASAFAAKPKVQAVQEPPKTNEIDEAGKKVSTFLNEFGETITDLANAKDAGTVQNIMHNNTLKFVDTIFDLAKNLQSQMHDLSGDASKAVGQMVAKLNATAEDLQKQHPEATETFKKYSETVNESFKNIVQETDKMVKSFADNSKTMQDDLAKLTKKAYDQVLESAQGIQKQIHDAANKQ